MAETSSTQVSCREGSGLEEEAWGRMDLLCHRVAAIPTGIVLILVATLITMTRRMMARKKVAGTTTLFVLHRRSYKVIHE